MSLPPRAIEPARGRSARPGSAHAPAVGVFLVEEPGSGIAGVGGLGVADDGVFGGFGEVVTSVGSLDFGILGPRGGLLEGRVAPSDGLAIVLVREHETPPRASRVDPWAFGAHRGRRPFGGPSVRLPD